MTGSHPDDDAISAHLDGLAPEVATHLARCDRCRARQATLRTVANAMATPPPPPPAALVTRAVAAALASTAGAPPDVAHGHAIGTAHGATTDPSPGPSHRPRRRRTRPVPPPAWVAVAAAAIAILAAVPTLLGDGSTTDRLATGSRSTDSQSPHAAALAPAESALPVFGNHLGDQFDPVTLVSLVSDAVANPVAAAGAADRESDFAAPGSASPATRAAAGAPPRSPAPCISEAVSLGRGRLGALVYVAPVRWKGVPATVLVFVLDDPERRARYAYVMSLEGCELLAEQRF